ncbi:MAG: hypothetical protein QM802_04090 [Agriterribacter sp.]
MITTRKLKTWTILSHAFIIVGAGHGMIFFAGIEILGFPYFFHKDFSFSFIASVENHLPAIGFTALLGQAAFVFSILHKKQIFKTIAQVAGLALLWLSVIYFMYDSSKDSYTHIATFTCIPFAICTIITFAGRPITSFYNWVLEK